MKKTNEKKSAGGFLRFLYNTVPGRVLLRLLSARWVSKAAGAFLSSRMSKFLIKGFVKNNNIDLGEYENEEYKCFNDCFTRRIKAENRPFDTDPSALVCPCDGLLSAYRIKDDTVMPVKQSTYTVKSLLQNDELSECYRDGIALVFRLCVDNYHRYSYMDNGTKGDNVFIKGRLHTVRPVALEARPVFVENCREYTVMETENFGKVTEIEVGAMLVGKIANKHKEYTFARGEEKGMFLYGGSTVVLLFEKNSAVIREELFAETENGVETPVKMGEKIGERA